MSNFTIFNSGKSAFGNAFNTHDASDYMKDKKSQILYSKKNNNKYVVGSQGDYLLLMNANNLDNTIETPLNYIDTTNLVFGLYTTEELTGINAVTDVSFNDLSCNEFIPTIIDLSGQPFYYKYKIDPCGELFGNSVCGYNNYEKYRILNKSL